MPSISELPPELNLLIGEFLGGKDRLNFSAANSGLRELFNPLIFSVIRFTNREQDADYVTSIVEKHGHHARHLHFVCYFYPNPEDEDDDEGAARDEDAGEGGQEQEQEQPGEGGGGGEERTPEDEASADSDDDEGAPENDSESGGRGEVNELPDWTHDLLSGKTLPNVHSLTVELYGHDNFEAVDGGWGGSDQLMADELGGMYIAYNVEDGELVNQAEEEWLWRRFFSQFWEVLSTNESVHNLEIINMIPREASFWSSSHEQWQKFLAQIQKFSMSIWDVFFFDHLSNITHLEVVGYPRCPYGCKGLNTARLALSARQMPKIQLVELENCLIDPNLTEFLASHSRTIERLTMTECAACVRSSSEDEFPWSDFLRGFHTAESCLEHLVIRNKELEFEHDRNTDNTDANSPAYNIKSIRELIANGERQSFSYVLVDDKYGDALGDEFMNMTRWEEGSDQREFDSLMELISRNAGKVERHGAASSLSAPWIRLRKSDEASEDVETAW